MTKLSKIDPELASIRDEKKKISSDLDHIKLLIDDKEVVIQANKAQSQTQRDKHSEVRDAAEVFTISIDKANEEIKNCYVTKDQMRESYYKQLMEWELQNDKVRWIKGLMNQTKKVEQQKEYKQDRIAKKRAELESRENPHLKEI